MPRTRAPLRVAVLVDLPRSALSGGHVKGWESRAKAVAASDLPVDLTLFFSGSGPTEYLAPNVCLRHLKPVFSTKNLRFLPYVPDHTDLAPYHPALAKELRHFDVIHTTDAYFAFSRTAEKISKKYGIPLVTSFHTDTPSYARVFTRNAIETIFGKSRFSRFLTEACRLPERQEQKMIRRLHDHLAHCKNAFVVRPEDAAHASSVIGKDALKYLKIVSNKMLFNPDKADAAGVRAEYGIPDDRLLALFVGRLDVGKNIYTLIEAMEHLIAKGLPVHLIAAGKGPADKDLKNRLGDHVTLAGVVPQEALARLMASCDIFTFPSEIEIRSFVSVEALSSGLPVLVAEKSGIADLIPADGALVPVSGDGEAWADAIGKLVLDRRQVEKMKDKARRFAKENIITWEESLASEFLPVWENAALPYKTESHKT
jgi:glycosyltransferase involved in cell wall biosynthesis